MNEPKYLNSDWYKDGTTYKHHRWTNVIISKIDKSERPWQIVIDNTVVAYKDSMWSAREWVENRVKEMYR